MRYLIAGAFSKTMPIMNHLRNYKGDADIVVYDGINKCKWNGGRINRDIFYSDGVIQYYYKRKISIALTFTNHKIELDDETGNHLLKKFHRKGNAIILINDNLRKYIRKNYPKYQLIYSITGMGHLNIPLLDADIEPTEAISVFDKMQEYHTKIYGHKEESRIQGFERRREEERLSKIESAELDEIIERGAIKAELLAHYKKWDIGTGTMG